jgi:putative transposase
MILTYQLKHTFDVSVELEKAKQVAEFSVKHRTLSSADVSHIGLKSAIANQILRKYGKNRKTKRVHSVNLVIPSQSIKVDQVKQTIKIACLKLEFSYRFRNDFSKINSIEISANRIFVSATFPEEKAIVVSGMLGVDRNATGHLAVAADATRGKVIKLGKAGPHIRRVYSKLRRRFQQKANYRKIKAMEKREARRTDRKSVG